MSYEYDCIFKLLLIGDSGTGKSSILNRYVDDSYSENYISTIGVDFKIKTVEYGDKVIKLQIWDTAGQERFRSITSTYYRNANGVLIVCDLSNPETFDSVPIWLEDVSEVNGAFQTILVGNKCDLQQTISQNDINALSTQYNLDYVACSAKKDINIEKVFNILIEKVMKDIRIEPIKGHRKPISNVLGGHNVPLRGSSSGSDCCSIL